MKLRISCLMFLILLANLKCDDDKEKDINIKVVPARSNKLTIEDLDQIKMEILHDVILQYLF